MKYLIDYHTGEKKETITGTLANAMRKADEGARYTGMTISIMNEEGEELAYRNFWPYRYSKDDEYYEDPKGIISFGEYGFYGNWWIV